MGGISPLNAPADPGDLPDPSHHIPIGIIGDGYTAAALTYHALKANIPHDALMIFGPSPLGHGRAYGTMHDDYRLNVRADLMLIDPEHPDDFKNWAALHINDPQAHTEAGDFYRRRDYARYLTATLNDAAQHRALPQCKKTVTSITPAEHNTAWHIWSGPEHIATCGHLVLATGNPAPVFDIPDALADKVTPAPWRELDTARIASSGGHTAIIGGGLTGFDVITALAGADHQGHITLITPGGHVPPPQLNWNTARAKHRPDITWHPANTASSFARNFIRQLDHNALDDVAEQEKFEYLRHDLNTHWTALPHHHRTRLMKRLGWCWQKIRYRASPQSTHAMDQLQKAGRFTLKPGRVIGMKKIGDTACLLLDDGTETAADHVIIATGRGHDAFLEQLMANNIAARPFQTDAEHHVVTAHNGVVTAHNGPPLFALGPPTIISQGDVMAASTIAAMAKTLAERLSRQISQ